MRKRRDSDGWVCHFKAFSDCKALADLGPEDLVCQESLKTLSNMSASSQRSPT
jgi:hypothetical protein